MKIESIQANKGDCFMVTWNNEEKEHTIIIDSGTKGTYRFIKKKIKSLKKIDGIIITHVDYDHIGGVISMVDDDNCPINFNFPFYINTPELILSNNESDKVHYKHGTSLEKALNEKKINKIAIHRELYQNNILVIQGLKLTILSPNLEILNKLTEKWTKTGIYEKYIQENNIDGKVSKHSTLLKPYNDIINGAEELHEWKDDLINSSSIAFILEKDGAKILFLGDSNSKIIEEALINEGKSDENKLKVDLVKISHHGSKFNTSKNLLKMIDCDKYYISTNGGGPYYHPHRETVIKIAEYSRQNTKTQLTIYTNYDLKKHLFISPEEEVSLNLKIEKKNEVNF